MIALEVGQSYYLETFGKYYVGRVAELTGTEAVLHDAAWVAYTGRLGAFVRTGSADGLSVEAVGVVRLPLAYVSAAYPWPHDLFTKDI